MRVRFQADADLNQVIVKAVLRREPGVDFVTAQAAGLPGLNDQEVLAIAAASSRVLVTHDRRSMPKEFAGFITTQTSAGVLVVPQKMAISQAVEELVLIWTASEAEEWINRIYCLPL